MSILWAKVHSCGRVSVLHDKGESVLCTIGNQPNAAADLEVEAVSAST